MTNNELCQAIDEGKIDTLTKEDIESAMRHKETTNEQKHHLKVMMKEFDAASRFSHHANRLYESWAE